MKNIHLIVLIATMLFSGNLNAIQVSGTVTSKNTGNPVQGVNVSMKSNVMTYAVTDQKGHYSINVPASAILVFRTSGMQPYEEKVNGREIINVILKPVFGVETEVDEMPMVDHVDLEQSAVSADQKMSAVRTLAGGSANYRTRSEPFNREGYATIHENGFKEAIKNPLSTFSIDVDAASYSNMRRFLNNGRKPPVDAVRIEEMINYFSYNYPEPEGKHPFAIYRELNSCPWNKENMLLHVGLQGKKLDMENLPPSNIVFLLDVSGSMNSPNKLPLLKKAFELLVKQLDKDDRVAIVVYAGSSGLVLPSTRGDQKEKILESLNNLRAGGTTAGAAGLKLAYEVAAEHFIRKGNNRIILATDGDFNVGVSSDAEMERLIMKKREKGIFISVLGFGMGNYQDSKMEIIADKGNGNYAYIDNILEAKKVLVNEFGGTLFTIAKDVKIQIEFNPAIVKKYRLIGYENRLLNDEDFEDDKKDAGELGAGHTVTALYEIVLADQFTPTTNVLKYQISQLSDLGKTGAEIATLKFRYKKPDGEKSILMEEPIVKDQMRFDQTSDNFRFSAAVAGFGMMLRDSKYKGDLTTSEVIRMAQASKGEDKEGYRSELIRLMKLSEHL